MKVVLMPRLADGMEEGTVLEWLADDEQQISAGDDLAEIETDKATMTYAAEDEGVLQRLVVAGTTVKVGDPIAQLLDAGEQPTSRTARSRAGAPPPSVDDAPPSEPDAERRPALVGAGANGSRVKASPVARRLAREHAVDILQVMGSGPRGRIVKQDVLDVAARRRPDRGVQFALGQEAVPEVTAGHVAAGPDDHSRGRPTGTQLSRAAQLVARRMTEVKATVPDFKVTTSVRTDAILAMRDELRAVADPVPSINDIIVRACGLTLRRHLRLNSSLVDDQMVTHERINVGIAVAGRDDGLVVPTVFDADRRGLQTIASESRALAAAVRDGSITLPQLSGGTFTVSNLGMYGVVSFDAIINAPQVAILAVGASLPAYVEMGPIHSMNLTLTCDHRVVYGAHAAAFLADLKALLERPVGLAL